MCDQDGPTLTSQSQRGRTVCFDLIDISFDIIVDVIITRRRGRLPPLTLPYTHREGLIRVALTGHECLCLDAYNFMHEWK